MSFSKRFSYAATCSFIAMAITLPVLGQSPAVVPEPRIRVERLLGKAPIIDGVLDEPAWHSGAAVSGFRQKQPDEGEPAREKTEVRFRFDAAALYIGARMYCENPQNIVALTSRRDDAGNSDRIIISFDTYFDQRTAYSFGITASGVRVDYYHSEDNEFRRDYSYDPIWQGKARIDGTSWTAEFRIPFSQLRFRDLDEQTWGININRWNPSLNEDDYWIQIPRNATGWSSQFGRLEGINGIKPGRRLELLPYAAGDLQVHDEPESGNPFSEKYQYAARSGVDLKMGIGPNLTLDATINPDFGQVEADPAEVNLSAFESFFKERRPFFTEGNQLLQGPRNGPNYYYSRRIGASPRFEPDEDFVDQPDNTTILGATKLSGQLNSGLSVGMLGALTAREFAATFSDSLNQHGREEVAPLTGFGLLRLQQTFGAESSTAGFILTGVRRDVEQHSELAGLLARQAVSGGGDWNLRFQEGKYVVSGHLGFSHVAGDTGAIAGLQRSSARYFQRPDAGHFMFDSTRRSLSGYSAALTASKNSGRHWLWWNNLAVESPGFELNDMGILRAADEVTVNNWIAYRDNQPGAVFRDYRISLSLRNWWNFAGIRQGSRAELQFDHTWRNYWRTSVEIGANTSALSATLARGGPLMATGSGWWTQLEIKNSFAGTTQWEFDGEYDNDGLGSWEAKFDVGLTLRPANRWALSISPDFEKRINTRQYITVLEGGAEATFGDRYIFSTVDSKTLSARVRLNYSFTPDLSLELYAEPFAARGAFYDFGELPEPRSDELRIYGTDGTSISKLNDDEYQVNDGGSEFVFERPDFNVRSFRSNLVLRWEWRPGSTFFLVWQQDRSGDEALEQDVGIGSLFHSLDSGGDQFVALKFSYWLPVE